MTRRITVSLPDDVAEYLDQHPNSSAVVSEAVRACMEQVATTRPPTEEQRVANRRRLDAIKARAFGRLLEH
jgi:Arc/MetJ-type ribon-helix-helix transcriptional regulator